jgi:1-phosphofructokinase
VTRSPSLGRTRNEPTVAVFAPAPVLVTTLEHPEDESAAEVAVNVGGQGPWVARAVQALGAHAVLVVPLGGDTGRVARSLLAEEPHEVRAVETKAAIAFYVEERRGGERTCLRDVPPGRFGQREIDDLYSAALAAAIEAGVCVITGSPWERHVDAALLRRLTTDLASLGVLTVADVSGEQLHAVLAGGVDWLKVARSELVEGESPEGDDEGWLWERARELASAGGRDRHVVVSRGSAPTLVVARDERYLVTTPELSTVDSRGSGDAMTAALATGLAEGRSLDELLCRASAAGASNAVHKGSGTPDIALVDRLAGAVDVRAVPPGQGSRPAPR